MSDIVDHDATSLPDTCLTCVRQVCDTGVVSATPADPRHAAEGTPATVREAAKWLLSAFAAIFAVVIAGLQFSALGSVDGAAMYWAAGSAMVALTVSIAVVIRAGLLLADPGLTFDDLLKREVKARIKLVNQRQKTDARLRTVGSVDPLLARVISDRSLLHHDRAEPSRLRDALRAARSASPPVMGAVEDASADIAVAVGVGNDYHFRTRFRSLITLTAWLAALCAGSVVIFAISTAGAQRQALAVPEAAPGVLYLKPGLTGAAMGLGETCAETSISVMLVGGTYSEPVVAVPRTASCTAGELTVSRDIGIVVPDETRDGSK